MSLLVENSNGRLESRPCFFKTSAPQIWLQLSF